MNDIFKEVLKQKIPYANYCSDLYIPVNDQTRELINQYDYKKSVTIFKDKTGEYDFMYDIPFAYTHYYNKD